MLSARKEEILRIVVADYITKGLPVSSESVARKGLGVSSATIRNEMIELEQAGYLTQPHHSAGRIPSDEGYRYYVKSLMREISMSPETQRTIRHQFHQVEGKMEEWIRLAAAILSGWVHCVAIVTLPKAVKTRLKHVELVSLQERLALLVLILWEAKLKQQMLSLERPVSQEELSAAAQRLTSAYRGLTSDRIASAVAPQAALDASVADVVAGMMRSQDSEEYEEPYVEGLRHVLERPDFVFTEHRAAIMEVFDQRRLLRSVLPRMAGGEGVQVVVGNESRCDSIQGCSIIITKYGVPGEVSGAVGVVGPTRMSYERAVPAVRFLSSVMSELVGGVYR